MAYLRLPDGSYFQFDDSLSDEQAAQLAQRKYPDVFGVKQKEGFFANLGKATRDYGETSLGALTGDRARLERNMDDQTVKSTQWDDVKGAFQQPGITPGLKELGAFARDTLAGSLPQMGATMTGARLGAMAGSPFGPVGTLVGGGAGALLASVPAFAGQNAQTQIEQQRATGQQAPLNMGAAYGAAVPQALLDAGSMYIGLGKLGFGRALGKSVDEMLGKTTRQLEEAAVREARRTLLASSARAVGRSVATEMPTEVAQQVLQRAQAGQELLSTDAMREYEASAAGAAVLGPVMGSVGGVHERAQARRTVEDMQQREAAAAAVEAERQRKEAADAAAKAEADKIHPLEAMYNDGQRFPEPAPDTSFVDYMSTTPPPAAPARTPMETFLRSIDTPEAVAYGESGLTAQQVAQALVERRPDLAQELIQSRAPVPGVSSTEESNLWRRWMRDQLKAAGKVEPVAEDVGGAQTQALVEGQDALGKQSLGLEMAEGREQVQADRVTAERAAAVKAAQESKRQAEERGAYQVAGTVEEQLKAQQNSDVDEGRLTRAVAKQLGLHVSGEADLLQLADARAALPSIQERIAALTAEREAALKDDTVELTTADGELTPAGRRAMKSESQLAELQRLATHANRTIAEATAARDNDAKMLGQLAQVGPLVSATAQPQHQKALATEHAGAIDTALMDLESSTDELRRGVFFKDPAVEQEMYWRGGDQRGQRVRRGELTPDAAERLGVTTPVRREEKAMSMERTLRANADRAASTIVNNMLQEASARRAAAGINGLTQTDAIRAAMDVRSAMDGLVDRSRRIDDSELEGTPNPKKDKWITDSHGHKWKIEGRDIISKQEKRAKEDPLYAAIRNANSYQEAVELARDTVNKAREQLASPPASPRRPGQKVFDLAPQTEATTQAIEARAAGAQEKGAAQTRTRIEDATNRIDKALSLPGDRQSLALLERVKQFLLNTAESRVQYDRRGNVTNRDPSGALPANRPLMGRAEQTFMDNVDSALDRVSKGMPVDPKLGMDLVDHINGIERGVQDQGEQQDMFAEPTALTAKNPGLFRSMLNSREKAEGRKGNQKWVEPLKRLDDNIARARAKVDGLAEQYMQLVNSKPWSAKLVQRDAEETQRLLSSLEEQRAVIASMVRDNDPEINGKLSSTYRQVVAVNKASAEMQAAIAKAKATSGAMYEKPDSPQRKLADLEQRLQAMGKADYNLKMIEAELQEPMSGLEYAQLKKRETEARDLAQAARREMPALQAEIEKVKTEIAKTKPQQPEAPAATFEQPKQVEPGTGITKAKNITPDVIVKRKNQEYTMVAPSWDEKTGDYVPPPTRRVITRETVEAVKAKKAVEKERIRQEIEDRQRQQALRDELKAKGMKEKVSLAERAKLARAASAISNSARATEVRKSLPKLGKGAPETALRTPRKTREAAFTPGTPPEVAPPAPEARPTGNWRGTATVPLPGVRKQDVEKKRAADKQLLKEKVEAQRAAHAARATKQAEARKKKSVADVIDEVEPDEFALKGDDLHNFAERIKESEPDTAAPYNGMSLKAAASWGATADTTPVRKALFAHLASVLPDQATVKAVKGVGGLYSHTDGMVYVGTGGADPIHALLHELTHAATIAALRTNAKLAAKFEALRKAVQDHVDANGLEQQYGLESIQEFAAETFSSAEFQRLLHEIPFEGNKSVWQRIVEFIADLIGAKGVARTALQEAMLLTQEATTQGATADAKINDVFAMPERKYADDFDPALRAAAERLIAKPNTFMQKAKANMLGFRMQFIDRFDPLEKIASRLDDSTKASQMMYWLRMYGQTNNFMSEIATNGTLYIDKTKRADGKTEYMAKSKKGASLRGIMEALRADKSGNPDAVDAQFKLYMIAERAKAVGYNRVATDIAKADGTPLVSAAELEAALAAGRANPAFQNARKLYREYNHGLIDFAKDAGALSTEQVTALKASNDYVSFYRQNGDNVDLIVDGERIGTIGNLKTQPYLHELVGGDTQITGFIEGALRNTHMLTDMALRNLATRNTANTLEELGLAKIGNGPGPSNVTSHVIRFKADGEDKFAVIDTDAIGVPSEMVVHSMDGIATQMNAAVKLLGVPAKMLRHFIVRNPAYAVRQIFRDSTAAALMTGADVVPVLSPMKQLAKSLSGATTGHTALQERGIVGGQVITGDIEDRQNILKQIMQGKTGWQTAMARLDSVAMQADSATRMAIYEDARKKGMSDMEASLMALESMNFNRRGLSPTVRALNTMIPFMNAQIQGLDVLYRAMTGKMPYADKLQVQRKFFVRGLMMAAATMAYAAAMEDDEDYQNATADERYNNWFVPIPGTNEKLKVPIPFEPGYLFKALPEAVYNLVRDKDDGRAVMDAFLQMGMNMTPGLVPQGVKPFIEATLNRSFFTGKEIEDARMKGLKASERYSDRTSETAKMLGGSFEIAGRELGVSPVMIEHFVRGYTGALGIAILGLADGMVANAAEKPTSKMSQTPIAGPLFLEKDGAGIVALAYKRIEELGKAKATFDKMVKEGRGDDAQEFLERYADDVGKAEVANKTKAELGKMTQLEQQVRADKGMSADEKRTMLDDIRRYKIELSKNTLAALRD